MLDFLASLNWYSLVAIALFVFLDLGLRLWIFGRLESIALDISLFSFVYCLVEFVRVMYPGTALNDEARAWGLRLAGIFAIVIVLSIIHSVYNSSLRDLIDQKFEEADESLSDDDRKLLKLAKPLIRRSVVVTFVGPETPLLRKGKKNWRNESAALLNRIAGKDTFTAEALLLPAWQRNIGALMFLLGSAGSLVLAGTG